MALSGKGCNLHLCYNEKQGGPRIGNAELNIGNLPENFHINIPQPELPTATPFPECVLYKLSEDECCLLTHVIILLLVVGWL